MASSDLWEWNKLDTKEILNSMDPFHSCAVYPPHKAVNLLPQNPNALIKLAQENAKIHDICKGYVNFFFHFYVHIYA